MVRECAPYAKGIPTQVGTTRITLKLCAGGLARDGPCKFYKQSGKGHTVDALACRGDEGRVKLR